MHVDSNDPFNRYLAAQLAAKQVLESTRERYPWTLGTSAMPVPTNLSFLGIAKETTKGTAVNATAYLPLKTIDPLDRVEYFPVDVLQGAMADIYGEIPGYKYTEFSVGGPVFADTFGWVAGGIMGEVVTATGSRTVADGVTTITTPGITSATAAFTQADVGRSNTTANFPAGSYIASVQSATAATMNTNATASGAAQSFVIGNAAIFGNQFSLLNTSPAQPTSHTLTDYYAVTQARQYAGVQWEELGLKFSTDGLLEYSAKATGLATSNPVAKPTQSFTTVVPIPTWAGSLAIAGVGVVKGIDGEVTFTRKIEVIKALTGNQTPVAIFLGQLAAKGKLVFYIDDDTELIRYLTNTQPAVTLLFTTGGTPATLGSVGVQFSKAAYTNAKLIRAKEFMQVEVELTAIGNVTDTGASGGYGPGIIRTQSLVAAGTYI